MASADDVSKSDRIRFPKWLRRYALTHPKGLTNELPVNRETVLRFLRSLLEAGAPAWQRWQAVRSPECYRDLVLKRSDPNRHKECRRLRIKDVWFDEGCLLVRNGKGQKDRMTFLPKQVIPDLKRQIAWATQRHQQDLEEGYDKVYLPFALSRKYPNAGRELGWRCVPSVRRENGLRPLG
ncbi:Integron integrase IntIPac [Rhodopirellula islandica]|uniref:Integron integrase IntIPac n=1 Tax=Rhodopirellula islandica TaxID=595434 RepID=A0A0J1BIE5_RHOIS|nr:Integron integrase IntIPac [Rhodopirellula islandica]